MFRSGTYRSDAAADAGAFRPPEPMSYYQGQIETLIDEHKLRTRVQELGAQLTRDYKNHELTVLSVLKGSVFFVSDLTRAMDLPLTMEFLGVTSYQGTKTTG